VQLRMARSTGSGLRVNESRKFFEALLLCTSFAFLSLTACHRPQGQASSISVREEIEPQPPVVGPATVTVSLADAEGRPLTQARLTVEGDMSHPGMSPLFSESKEVMDGRYLANIDFAMAGDWVLLLHIKLPEGETVERQIDVKGVRAK
jgi:hypothetical protein